MPEVFFEFLVNVLLWLLLLTPLFIWGKLNHDALQNWEKHPESFERVIGWLRENNFGLLYLKSLGWLMDKISDLIGDRQQFNRSYVTAAHPGGFIHKTFGLNPFTPESYEKCLRLAFLYPMFSFFIFWILGGSGKIGSFDFARVDYRGGIIDLSKIERFFLVISPMFSVFLGVFLVKMLSVIFRLLILYVVSCVCIYVFIYSINESVETSLLLTFIFSFFVILLWFLLFTSTLLGGSIVGFILHFYDKVFFNKFKEISFRLSIAVIFALLYQFASNIFKLNIVFSSGHLIALSFLFIIFDLSTAVSLGLAFFGAYLLMDYFMMVSSSFLDEDLLDSWGVFLSVLLIYLAGLFFIGATFVFISFVKKRFNEKNIKFFWVIYSVLLFLSGFIILSFKIDNYTHSYMYMLLFFTLFPLINAPLDWLSLGVTRGLLQAVRVGRYSGRWILTWAVVDLLMALFFLFLITALFIGVTVLGNVITGQKLVSIGCILHELWGSPEKVDHWWIYFMLLSTLVPTLIHFALAGGAVTLWLPRQWRLQLADGLERDIHKTFLAWTYLTFMPVIGFLLVPGALLYFLWWLLNMHGGWLGMRLLDWAEMLAHFANPAMQ